MVKQKDVKFIANDIPKENIEKEVKQDVNSEKVNSEKEYPYDVKICDIWGTTSKDQVKIAVQRRIFDSNVYLYNEKAGFKEPLPEDNDDFKDFKIEDINIELKKLEKDVNKKDNVNKKGLRQQIRRLKGFKSSIELQGRGSYMRLDENGRPYFEFDRVGNFKMPVYKNIDKSLLKTPDEAKIKNCSELLKENKEKNGDPDKHIKLINIAILIFLLLTLGLFGFLTYKTSDMPDVCSANIEKAAIVLNSASRKFENSAIQMNNITDRVYIKQPDIIPEINTTVIN